MRAGLSSARRHNGSPAILPTDGGDAMQNSGNTAIVVRRGPAARHYGCLCRTVLRDCTTFRSTASLPPRSGAHFFPAADPLTSLVAAFATYGVGFLMRPVGAIVVGAYGDRVGRKAALVFTVGLMGLATGSGGTPANLQYRLGYGRRSCLLILRLAQGFSTGGEWGGAAAFLVEHAPPGSADFSAVSTR